MYLHNRRHLALWLMLFLIAPIALWGGIALQRPADKTPEQTRLRVRVLNVGQGEATLVQTPSGGTILIGAGPTEVEDTVVEALQNAGVKRIDLLILPYPYAEAIGGVSRLFDEFEIRTILDPGGERINAHITKALRRAREFQTDWQTVGAGQVYSFRGDSVKVEILAPTALVPNVKAPDNSLVVAIRYEDTRFLFAGGIGKEGEQALLAGIPNLHANWLRVARSGSGDSSSLEFLRLVRPEFAVISVGPNGDNCPGEAALNRLKATGAKLYRTDENGGQDLIFWSDGRAVMQGDTSVKSKQYTHE